MHFLYCKIDDFCHKNWHMFEFLSADYKKNDSPPRLLQLVWRQFGWLLALRVEFSISLKPLRHYSCSSSCVSALNHDYGKKTLLAGGGTGKGLAAETKVITMVLVRS